MLAGLGPRAARALAASNITQQTWTDRAVATYGALQTYFYANDGTSLYRSTYPSPKKGYSNVWGFSRPLLGTLTLAGIPGISGYLSDVDDRLAGLARYWDGSSSPPGYCPHYDAAHGAGGTKFYDAQGWNQLALLQHYRMFGAESSLRQAEAVWSFVYPGGWDWNPHDPHPGGIYFHQWQIGVNGTKHGRTCTSNAPNAEAAFQLAQLLKGNAHGYLVGGNAIHSWLTRTLYDKGGSGLMDDQVTETGKIDPTRRTYNQGSMIAADVMRYRLSGKAAHLAEATSIARKALAYFSEAFYVSHSCTFNAIFFRGLLHLYSVTTDTALQAHILQTIQTYADDAWNNYRSPNNLFSFSPSSSYQLLDQGAMLQIFATLAWNSSDYPKLG
jgi:hypothetical protein